MEYLTAKEIINSFYNNPSKTALTYINEDAKLDYSISYKDFADAILGLAYFFHHELHLKTGDTVSFVFENCPEIIAINLACFLTGLTSCPLDSKRDTTDVALRKLEETNTKAFFYRNGTGVAKDIVRQKKDLKSLAIADFLDLKKLYKNQNPNILSKFAPEKIALILYTSGTTGFPKGALLTFANLRSGAKQVGEWFKITNEDTFYIVLPLHHINSTIFTLATLFAGGSLVIPSRYSGSNFFSDCARYKITLSSIVPTINLDLLEKEGEFNKYKKELSLKRIQLGSAPVSPKHAKEFTEKYKIRLIQGYGSTETSLRITGVPVDLQENLYQELLETNSIGIPLSENKVVLFDKDDKTVTSPGAEGEIGVKGNNIMQGYLNRPEETVKTLRGGYFHTGDLGFFKEIDGIKYYYLKGRVKEIIIKGGVNISPLFIEEKLRKQVLWAKDVVVVGFTHYRFGEEIGVIFIPKEKNYQKDFEQTLQDMKNNEIKNLDGFETPKAAIIALDEEIPKTATGKVQHIKAKEVFEQRLLENYRQIGKHGNFTFRIISPEEEDILQQAVNLHNHVFPKGLHLNLETLTHRATNGFVIGGFDTQNNLQGILTGFFVDESLIKKGRTWSEISGNGKFDTFTAKGEVAVLASAASVSSSDKNENLDSGILQNLRLTEKQVADYIDSQKDFVARFHLKPKAGFETGARVSRIILNGNPADLQSLGTVVIFQYPPLDKLTPKFTEDKVGLGLVEAAISFAKNKGKKQVIALSRLGEAYKYLKEV